MHIRKAALAVILLLSLSYVAICVAEEYLIIKSSGQSALVRVTPTPSGLVVEQVRHKTVDMSSEDDSPPPATNLSGTAKAVYDIASEIEHADRDAINSEVAEIYRVVGEKLSLGEFKSSGDSSPQQIAIEKLNKSLRTYLETRDILSPGATQAWSTAINKVTLHLAAMELRTAKETADAMLAVSDGFSAASRGAINPAISKIILRFVLAIIAGEDPKEILRDLIREIIK